jgi:YegS/Rv2252/BmrU family lipid kinase
MFHFIVNPNAGSKNKAKYTKLIQLIKSNDAHSIWETTEPLEAVDFAKKALEQGATRIIAVGGDGTINEVASVLVGKSIALGIIPVGSGNGLARHLNIPLNYKKAFQKALVGATIKIDVGHINNRPFFCTAGVGFDAAVAHRFANSKGRGLLNYIKATIITLFKYKPIQVSINNAPVENIFSLSIANANQFGNNAFISPFSNIQDGQLELVKIGILNKLQAGIIAVRLFKKSIHHSNDVHIIACKTASIYYVKNAPIHIDGENLVTDNELLNITISPFALNVIV